VFSNLSEETGGFVIARQHNDWIIQREDREGLGGGRKSKRNRGTDGKGCRYPSIAREKYQTEKIEKKGRVGKRWQKRNLRVADFEIRLLSAQRVWGKRRGLLKDGQKE